ncbi:hypothetical protein FB451DRAFT_275458 [Mycena latifolia]|nr:hypothetical protein FB451DRAFT_275458 [Mycena latifolia]
MSVCTAARRVPYIFQAPSRIPIRPFATASIMAPTKRRPKKRDPSEYMYLFRSLGHLKPGGKLNSNPAPALEKLDAHVSPRCLFAEMLATHFNAKSHPPAAVDASEREAQRLADSKLMDVALRAFSRREDYAGALVILSAFATHGLAVTERTYAAATDGIARRMAAESAVGRPLFTRVMLGATLRSTAGLSQEEKTRWVMERLVMHDMPPRALKLRVVPVGELDVIPLIFVVRRAFGMHGALTKSKTDVPWGAGARQRAEAKAKGEMLPKKDVSLWTWKETPLEILPST